MTPFRKRVLTLTFILLFSGGAWRAAPHVFAEPSVDGRWRGADRGLVVDMVLVQHSDHELWGVGAVGLAQNSMPVEVKGRRYEDMIGLVLSSGDRRWMAELKVLRRGSMVGSIHGSSGETASITLVHAEMGDTTAAPSRTTAGLP